MKLVSVAVAVLVAAPFAARGAAPSGPTEVEAKAAPSAPNLTVGLKAGGIFPQVLNRLSSTYTVALEVGWLLPILNRQLALVVEGAYSAPATSVSVEDPRVASGTYQYELIEQTFGLYAGPKYYFLPLRGTFIPWVSVGIRAQFIESQLSGLSEQPFGAQQEQGTHVAFGGQAGLGYHLGPGFLGLELQLISSPLDHLVTGKVDVGDLSVRAGYHFAF